MRFKIAAALAALPFTTTANAANVYAACYYQDHLPAICRSLSCSR